MHHGTNHPKTTKNSKTVESKSNLENVAPVVLSKTDTNCLNYKTNSTRAVVNQQ